MSEIAAILSALQEEPEAPAVLGTLVEVSGSSYRRPGARVLFRQHRPRVGSISGGCLEEDLAARADVVFASGVSQLVSYDTTSENDLVWGVGMGCHGIVYLLLEKVHRDQKWVTTLRANLSHRRPTDLTVLWRGNHEVIGTRLNELESPDSGQISGRFSETITPPPSLYIFGAGDDAQPLAAMAGPLGWRIVVADARPAFATRERFPSAAENICAPVAELVSRTRPEAGALAVVMTHHYLHDLPLLQQLASRSLGYLGLLGPRQRAERILSEVSLDLNYLWTDGAPVVHAPVGLDLGAENAAEIALSILAEIQATLRGRDARPLRERLTPIHG